MKTVFPSSELCHVWAKQSQQHGRSQASVFFEGSRIYSYGRHFCIADIIKPGIVLFTTRTYSVTTAKHIGWVGYACNHMERVMVPDPSGSLLDNLSSWQSEIESMLKDLRNPRKKPQTKDRIKGDLASLVKNINRYLEVTGQKLSQKLHADFYLYFDAARNEQAAADLQRKLDLQAKKKAKAEEKRKAELYAKAKKELSAWKAGRGNQWHNYRHLDLPVALRVENDKFQVGETTTPEKYIATSKGARVGYQSGKLLYKAIQAGRDVRGYDLDGYTVISVNGVLKVGCHEIDRKEIERFAKKEGW